MKIESLAPSAQPDGPLVCTLETGERLKVPTFLAADLNLYAGRELSEAELSALRAAIARARTRQRAVRILSSTAISRAALEKQSLTLPCDILLVTTHNASPEFLKAFTHVFSMRNGALCDAP